MTYQDLKALEANKVIKVITSENWLKADNDRCYRIVTALFGKVSLHFIEYEYVDMLHFSTYITSTNKAVIARANLAQKAFKKLENKLFAIESDAQVEGTITNQ